MYSSAVVTNVRERRMRRTGQETRLDEEQTGEEEKVRRLPKDGQE